MLHACVRAAVVQFRLLLRHVPVCDNQLGMGVLVWRLPLGLRRMLRLQLLILISELRSRLPVLSAGAANHIAQVHVRTAPCSRAGTQRPLLMGTQLLFITSVAAFLSGIAQLTSP